MLQKVQLSTEERIMSNCGKKTIFVSENCFTEVFKLSKYFVTQLNEGRTPDHKNVNAPWQKVTFYVENSSQVVQLMPTDNNNPSYDTKYCPFLAWCGVYIVHHRNCTTPIKIFIMQTD